MGKALTPNERLQTIGESTRAVVDRIVRVWQAAEPADVEAGAQWYPNAGAFVKELAGQFGLTRFHVAAVVAHLSPRTPWKRNKDGAVALLTSWQRDPATATAPGCLGANVARALRAIESGEPLKTLNGPKTQAFAANILGEHDRVTVDVWAVRIALGDREDAEQILARVGMYEAIEYAYQLAAARVDVSPATMQAVTWVVRRNGRAE